MRIISAIVMFVVLVWWQNADASAQAPVWYQRAVQRDLAGDARPDTAVLVARGTRPDSLRITLTLIVDGRTAYRARWPSSYELIDVDSAVLQRPALDRYMRARLDSVLDGVVKESVDTASVRLMADDPAVVARMRPVPTSQITLSYGYETTEALVWDAHARRFVRLWSCC